MCVWGGGMSATVPPLNKAQEKHYIGPQSIILRCLLVFNCVKCSFVLSEACKKELFVGNTNAVLASCLTNYSQMHHESRSTLASYVAEGAKCRLNIREKILV